VRVSRNAAQQISAWDGHSADQSFGEPVELNHAIELTLDGRLARDIRRKTAGRADLEKTFAVSLSRASQIRSQRQRQRGWKLYSADLFILPGSSRQR
jgi:hypothetical protein